MGAELSKKLGPYRLGDKLGSGGMGTVYRGFHELLERPVALKCISRDKRTKDTVRERFLREAQATARLNHPSVVQIYDIFEHEGDDWIAMEFVDGPTLGQLVRLNPMPWRRVVKISRGVASGLAAAHQAAIIHRDLKSENVLLAENDQPKILDFGLAKDFRAPESNASDITQEVLMGTPRVMSPEQAMNLPLDPRSDLFSLGTLIYEIASTLSPFAADTVFTTLHRVCKQRHRPLVEVQSTIPAALGDLVDRLLEKDPTHRPASAQEVIELLDAIDPPTLSGSRPDLQPLDPGPAFGGSAVHRQETMFLRGAPRGLQERRHVLVVSCEVETGDPEDLYDILPTLQARARAAAEAQQGCYIENPNTRLILCLGYPLAFEDDGRRALSLARSLLDELRTVAANAGIDALRLRVGIHTGVAYAPAEVESGALNLGRTLDQTIAVAQRAEPGQIVLSDRALPLVSGHCLTVPLGTVDLPGLGDTSLHGVSADESTGALWPLTATIPLIGRDIEVRLLQNTFRTAAAGGFQVAQVCGEAGLGKTKLLAGLRRQLEGGDVHWLSLQGTPETANSPFAAASHLLEKIFGLVPEMSEDQQIRRLRQLLGRLDLDEDHLPYLASLLPHTLDSLTVVDAPSPEAHRNRALSAMASLLAALSEEKPTVLACEDLHWLDPSSLEWIQLLIREQAAPGLLVVLTFRPHFVPPWGHRADIIQLNLNPLSRDWTRQILEQISNNTEMAPEVIDQIVAKTDGVPLFLEQLARAVLESADTAGGGPIAIPDSLRGSLVARLDRLGSAKEVAQYASVIGREFTLDLLRAISPFDLEVLKGELKFLVNAGIVHRQRGTKPTRFVFKHALIRDAAYDSLLKKDRRHLHRLVALELQQLASTSKGIPPELLAHHCQAGGMATEAIGHWMNAGSRCLGRSAHIEAISHLRQGLDLLGRHPQAVPYPERAEFDLLSQLGRALIAGKGYGEPGLDTVLQDALTLADRLDDRVYKTEVLHHLFIVFSYRGEADRMQAAAQRFLEHAEVMDEPMLTMEAHLNVGITVFFEGRLADARPYFETALDIARAQRASDPGASNGAATVDPSIALSSELLGRSFMTMVLWLMGFHTRAQKHLDELLALAEGTDPLSQATALTNGASCSYMFGDTATARRLARESVAISEENELYTSILARPMLGLACLRQELLSGNGDTAHGDSTAFEMDLESTFGAFEALRASGAIYSVPVVHCHLGNLLLERQLPDEARLCWDYAHGMTEAHGEQVWKVELLRLAAHLKAYDDDRDGAEEGYRQAIDLAHEQGAKSFALRAALDLHRLLASTARAREGRETVFSILESFDQSSDSPDLRRARELTKEGTP